MFNSMAVYDGQKIVGWVTSIAHKKAATLLGCENVQMEFRQTEEGKRLVWIKAIPR